MGHMGFMSGERTLAYDQQDIQTYANLPRIRTPDGNREPVDDADLWFAAKINSTLKKQNASEIYWEKKQLSDTKRHGFITGLRNHSLNRQHMGAFVVGSVDFEVITSSLVSSAFAQGKFYKMQQQTRRSVILDAVIDNPLLQEYDEVTDSYARRFDFYWDIVDRRPDKVLGFDPYIQDAFKVLPLSTKTRFAGNLDLRTAKGYTRWKELEYLPSSVREFGQRLDSSVREEYPLMFQSDIVNNPKTTDSQIHLDMINQIGSNDLLYEPMLWYADHTFILPENKIFEKIYDNLNLDKEFTGSGPDSIFLGYFNPLGLNLEELLELFEHKDEATKAATEIASFAVISRVDISGGIDTWRHTRVNRMIEPIYHALERGAEATMPVLYQRKEKSGSEIPQQYIQHSNEAIKLYHTLVKEGIPKQEAIEVLPHNIELLQIEMMDLFSFLNVMALRTCIHSRPEVQQWSQSILREVSKTPDFKGLDAIVKDGILARGLQLGYCAELGTCKKCGTEVIYLPDPIRE